MVYLQASGLAYPPGASPALPDGWEFVEKLLNAGNAYVSDKFAKAVARVSPSGVVR